MNELSGMILVCVITDAQLQRSITLVLKTEDDTARGRFALNLTLSLTDVSVKENFEGH